MRRIRPLMFLVVAASVSLVLGGCGASYHAKEVDIKKALLVNPDILTKGTDDQALYRYDNPKADYKKYTKLRIDPVIVSKAAELNEDDLENYQKLANNAHFYLVEELKKDYSIVTTSGTDVLRLQTAILDADSSSPVINLFSSIMPVGAAISGVKYSSTGKQSGVGEITVEAKITDAKTGELLGAAVDRRVGGKAAKGIWDTWYNADEALKYWAKKSRYTLCGKRGETSCQKPEAE